MRKAQTILTAAAVTLLLALAACGFAPGPSGRVVDKDRDWQASTKTYKYELTTRDSKGIRHEFPVSKSDFDACYRDSAYPKCTEVR